jgi:hypothetical protein
MILMKMSRRGKLTLMNVSRWSNFSPLWKYLSRHGNWPQWKKADGAIARYESKKTWQIDRDVRKETKQFTLMKLSISGKVTLIKISRQGKLTLIKISRQAKLTLIKISRQGKLTLKISRQAKLTLIKISRQGKLTLIKISRWGNLLSQWKASRKENAQNLRT